MRMRRVARAAASLVVLVVLVAGVPAALASLVGWPLPAGIPDMERIGQGLRSGVSDAFVVKFLAVVGWVAWAQVASAVMVEIAAVVRRRPTVRLPVMPGVQLFAAHLVAGIAAISTVTAGAGAGAGATPADFARPPQLAAPLRPASAVADRSSFISLAESAQRIAVIGRSTTQAPGADREVGESGAVVVDAAAAPVTVGRPTATVRRHDSYWAIAERTLGDGLRWREIHELNAGRVLADGSRIDPTDDTLHAGWVLWLPDSASGESASTATGSVSRELDATPRTEPPATASGSDASLPEASLPEASLPEAEVVVERGDNLWSISEDHLEQGWDRQVSAADVDPYWRAVIDTNRDRLVDPGDPGLILPGQRLALPATPHTAVGQHAAPAVTDPNEGRATTTSPTDAGEPSEPSEPTRPAEVNVEPTVPGVASTVPTTAAAITTTTAAATTTATTTAAATSIGTGAPVATDSTSPEHPDSTTASRGTEPEAASAATDRSDTTDPGTDGEGEGTPGSVWLFGGLASVAMAVGLKRLMRRRQREALQESPRRISAPTPPESADLHRTVVATADEQGADRLGDALAHLAVGLAAAGSPRRPRLVRWSPDEIEVLLDRPSSDPPPGWTSTAEGAVWSPSDQLAGSDAGAFRAAPLLVTIGPQEDAQLLLDLESEAIWQLRGDPAVAAGVARSIVCELGAAALAETLRVVVVGELAGCEVEQLEHVRVASCWGDVADDARAWALQSHEAMVANGWPTTFVGRAFDPDHDALVPMVVVCDEVPPAELVGFVGEAWPSAVTVVVVGVEAAVAGASMVTCHADRLVIESAGIECPAPKLDPTLLSEVCALVASSSRTEPAAGEEPVDRLDAEAVATGAVGAVVLAGERPPAVAMGDAGELGPVDVESAPPECEVLVRFLGVIGVEGGPKQLKPKATSVVAYLALHRSVTSDRLEEACWWDANGGSHRKRLRDVMTECRDAIGAHLLPANRNGFYVAEDGIGTDLDLFDWHLAQGDTNDLDVEFTHLQAALGLVTGQPFSYPNLGRGSFAWVDLEHHATTWELHITKAAQRFADVAATLDRGDDALPTLQRLCAALPADETLAELVCRGRSGCVGWPPDPARPAAARCG